MHKLLRVLLLFALTGCQTAQPFERDALLLNPIVEVQKELEAAIGKMLNSNGVLINPVDLTRNSILPVERKRLNDANGQRMQGFELEEPHYFKLVRTRETCFLVLLKSTHREPLALAKCQDR